MVMYCVFYKKKRFLVLFLVNILLNQLDRNYQFIEINLQIIKSHYYTRITVKDNMRTDRIRHKEENCNCLKNLLVYFGFLI